MCRIVYAEWKTDMEEAWREAGSFQHRGQRQRRGRSRFTTLSQWPQPRSYTYNFISHQIHISLVTFAASVRITVVNTGDSHTMSRPLYSGIDTLSQHLKAMIPLWGSQILTPPGFDQCLPLALVYNDWPTDRSGRFKDLKGNSSNVALYVKLRTKTTLPIMQPSHVYIVPGKYCALSNSTTRVCNAGFLIKI